MPRRASAMLIAVLLASTSGTASARSAREFEYGFDPIWRAAVRMVAVDFRFPVTERDPEIGYLLFEYRDAGRAYPASLELVRVNEGDPNSAVRVVVQVGSMPSYVERMLLDRLGRKLGEDYGAPIRRPSAPRPAPPADAPPTPPEAAPAP